ncbi:hypothetical protein KC345_g210 [Hortaea werneckii]|nr:hypothetical protein KC345_g210 [Hortaea werneckii]
MPSGNRRQVGVDLLIGLSSGLPGYGVAGLAAECDGWDALFRGFSGGSHCPREEGDDAEIAAYVLETVAHGGDGKHCSHTAGYPGGKSRIRNRRRPHQARHRGS